MTDGSFLEPGPQERKWDFDRVFRLLLTVAGVIGLFLLLRYLADVLIPFALALLLAFLLNPIVTALESRIRRRTPAVLITVLGCGVVAFSVSLILIFVASQELASLRDLLRQFVRTPTAEEVTQLETAFDDFVEKTHPAVRTALREFQQQVSEGEVESIDLVTLLQGSVRLIAPSMMGFVSGAVAFILGLTGLVVVLLYLVFLLIDYRRLSGTWRGFLPPKYREDIIGFIEEFRLSMSLYFRGQFIIAVIMGILFAIGFKLIGLRMAILLGLGIGMLNMVPYLQVVGIIPAMLLALARGLESGQPLWLSPLLVLVVFAVVQVIQDTILTPRILGQSVGLRPVVLLLGIFIWGKLLGFLGLVLAIPLTCLGLAYYRRFVLGESGAKAVQTA